MGLDAQVIAIGPFSQEALPALEYPATFYSDLPAGATVVSNVFIARTSEASHQLAQAFGVGAMDLGKHVLNPEAADQSLLRDVFGAENVEQFQLLAKCAFTFYYLPNG